MFTIRVDVPAPRKRATSERRKRLRLGLVTVSAASLLIASLAACGSSSSNASSAPSSNNSAESSTPASTASSVGSNALAGTPAPKPLAKKTSVTLGIGPVPAIGSYSAFYLAQAMGEFAKENLDVKLVTVGGSNNVVLLQQGKLAAAPSDNAAFIYNAIHSGADVRIVAGGPVQAPGSEQAFWFRSSLFGPDGKLDPCSLKGKTIGMGTGGLGGSTADPLAKFLAKCNLTVKDVKVSPVIGPNALIALQKGALDGAILNDPLWQDAKQKGYAKMGIPFDEGSSSVILMGSSRHTQPDVAEAILRALVRTERTYMQGDYLNNPKVVDALIKVGGFQKAQLQPATAGVYSADMGFNTPLQQNLVEDMQKTWIQAGLLTYKTPLPFDQVVDQAPLKAALGE